MLYSIIGYVKEFVANAVDENSAVPSDKKDLASEATTAAVINGFREHFTSDNISGLTDLFSGKGHSIVDSLKKAVSDTLTEKVGLSTEIANSISTSVVPPIIKAISNKVNDPNEKDFCVESVIGAFIGEKANKKGGLLDTIGGFFG
ncbi:MULTISPECIES: hypothetical protein [unclassified Dysgonomonas]|uniref:hypothetical protein n=1 Tax=unclassified Dysgonomonas TaxID=2630389 RepID=UPI0013ECDCEF|nr:MULTISPECIES: hypothetical protein [unclassified Dysgonomonas]